MPEPTTAEVTVAAIRASYDTGVTVLHSATEIGVLLAEIDRLTAARDEARQLVRELAGSGRCDVDRKGNCETHDWSRYRSGVQHCPHGRAQRAGLTRVPKETDNA